MPLPKDLSIVSAKHFRNDGGPGRTTRSPTPTTPTYRDFLQNLTPPAEIGTRADIMAISVKEFEQRMAVRLSVARRRAN